MAIILLAGVSVLLSITGLLTNYRITLLKDELNCLKTELSILKLESEGRK